MKRHEITVSLLRQRHRLVALGILALACGSGDSKTAETSETTPVISIDTRDQIGRKTSVRNGLTASFHQYDALGRTSRSIHAMDGHAYAHSTEYGYARAPGSQPGNLITARIFPAEEAPTSPGERVEYGYDEGGYTNRISAIRPGFAPDPIIADIQRNPRGQPVRIASGDGMVSTRSYRDTGDLTLETMLTTDLSGAAIQRNTYAFDDEGNVDSISDGVRDFSADYDYDSLNQLVSFTSKGTTYRYEYDAVGNLRHKEGTAQEYGGSGRGPHALASVAGITYEYDANGNLEHARGGANGDLAIEWNADNMAVSSVQGGNRIQRSFLGESVWKKTERGERTYYLPSLRVEGQAFRKFYGEPNSAHAIPYAERRPDGALRFYHGDHLGSSVLMTGQNGVITHRAEYMPYGEERPSSVLDTAADESPRHQFNFKEKDALGIYDYGARLYNPATGRFWSADTHLADGPNRYAYVLNNPVNFRDPSGHESEPVEGPGGYKNLFYGVNYRDFVYIDERLVDLEHNPAGVGINYPAIIRSVFDNLLLGPLNDMAEWASRRTGRRSNEFTVHGHGSPGFMADGWGRLHAYADLASELPSWGWKPGQPIVLLGCNTWRLAERVASATGSPTKGTTDVVVTQQTTRYLFQSRLGPSMYSNGKPVKVRTFAVDPQGGPPSVIGLHTSDASGPVVKRITIHPVKEIKAPNE